MGSAFHTWLEHIDQQLTDLAEKIAARGEEALAARRTPASWSAKEILGHLVDSAANNHRRFILAQNQDSLEFDGYDQERWVQLGGYQQRSGSAVLELFLRYNRHLLGLVGAIPEKVRSLPRSRHNLHQIAWQTVPQEQSTTLQYFIEDYYGHLFHHLSQILPGQVQAPPPP
jgi:hypothetical protein